MYKLIPNEEQTQINESVRSFLAEQLPVERWRPNSNITNSDFNCWQKMAELGFFGLGIDEAQGGVGYGFSEEILLLRECGRYLTTPSIFSTLIAAHIAANTKNGQLCEKIISGEQRVAMALTVDANQIYIFDRREGDLILLQQQDTFFVLDQSALSNTCALECLDETVTLESATVALDTPVCFERDTAGILAAKLQVMLAAAFVGLAEAARDLSVDYAKVREQFGQPIGRFQAVKHHCADMAVRAELAWALTMEACLALQHELPAGLLKAAAAKYFAADASYRNSDAGIQVHGGIGFQAECNAHLFVKRSHVYDQMGGSAQELSKTLLNQPNPLR